MSVANRNGKLALNAMTPAIPTPRLANPTSAWRQHRIAPDLPILVTSPLPRGLLFLIDNRRTGGMLVKMSADILYSPKAIDALQFIFTSALGAWR